MGILERVFSRGDWREDLDQELVNKLEKLLNRTKTYEDAYKNASNPAMAQVWVGMAEILFMMDRLNARIRRLEENQKKLIEGVEDEEIGDEELRESLRSY